MVADEYGQDFKRNLVIQIEKCDFTSVSSVVGCARGMRARLVFLSLFEFRIAILALLMGCLPFRCGLDTHI
jgi:hypothetical protein